VSRSDEEHALVDVLSDLRGLDALEARNCEQLEREVSLQSVLSEGQPAQLNWHMKLG
jgi:hypothetical protein